MITEEFAQAFLAASKLPRSHQFALAELILRSPLTELPKPSPVVETPKRASRQNTQWKEDEEIRVLELEESMRHASKSKRKTLVRDAARELGRSEAAVVKHIWEMNNKGQKT